MENTEAVGQASNGFVPPQSRGTTMSLSQILTDNSKGPGFIPPAQAPVPQPPDITFSDLLERYGFLLKETIIADGNIHRVDVQGDKQHSKNGWYIFFDDGIASGAYGSWKVGTKKIWCAKANRELSPAERNQHRQRMKEAKQKRDNEKKRAQVVAAQKAADQVANAKPANPSHKYLKAKGVGPCGVLQADKNLIIPILDIGGKIQSRQTITPGGEKWFLTDGKIKGGMFTIGVIDGQDKTYLAEGFSTGATIHQVTGQVVVVAFNAGNLLPVARAIRTKYPDITITVCADNDQWTPDNPGVTKAQEVLAKVSGCKMMIPLFQDTATKPTDFNDLMLLEGEEAVQEQLQAESEDPSLDALEIIEKAIKIATTDPGAPFEKEVLEALSIIRSDDQAEYQRLRTRFKKASSDILITEMDKAVRSVDSEQQDDIPHLETARKVIQRIGPKNILFTDDTFYRWDGCGIWRSVADRAIKVEIQTETEEHEPTKSTIESILDLTKTECFRPRHQFNMATKSINVTNGELYLQGGKWVLNQHNRENYRTTQLPIQYDPKAQAPRFCQFLAEIFNGDHDVTNKSIVVTELLGYSILTTSHLEKFVLLIGCGANGKSVLLDVVESLVGRESVAAVQPSQFDNRFQRAHLNGKLVNLITELAEGAEIHDAQLKSITSGELTTAEHKHKDPFNFTPFSTCWFGTNHMPHTRDFSEALFRRAIILTFNQKFYGANRDVHLKEKLRAELPGILNLALSGAADILKNGEFTTVESSEKAKKIWRVEADQVAQFVEERCILDKEASATSREIWQSYRFWTGEVGIKRSLNRNNFSNRLVRLGIDKVKGAGGVRRLLGIRLDGYQPEAF